MKKVSKKQISLTLLSEIAKPHCDLITNVIFNIIHNDLAELNEFHKDYTQVFRILSLFSVRVSHITNGILSLFSENNTYCSNILLRSLIEHAYKIDYITRRALHDKNDLVAQEYLQFCDFAEELQYQYALDYRIQIIDNKSIDGDAYADLLNRKPELKEYSKKEIFEKSKQFSFSNIHKYLNNTENIDRIDLQDKNFKEGLEAFLYNAALYSDLSSFVHGGPFAEKSEMLELDKEKNNDALFKIMEYLMMLHAYANVSISSFFSDLDEKYNESSKRIMVSLIDYYKKI